MSDRPVETEVSALQALLQIRTIQAEGAAAERGTVGNTETAGNDYAAQTAATSNLANLLRLGASQASLLQQAAHGMSFTPTQLAAIRAAATFGIGRSGYLQDLTLQNQSFMATAAAAVAARPAPATLHQHSPRLGAISRDSSLAAASAPMEVPRSPGLSPIRSATARAQSTIEGSPLDAGSEEAEKKIRKEEVEAALNSKPQRGRKRENLNAEERMELTRTRNREHAKSTRVRKKARYQELLDTEQKYLELQSEAEVNGKRGDAVVKFLEARSSMLCSVVDRRGRGGSKHTGKEIRVAGEARAVSFDHAEVFEIKGAPGAPGKAKDEPKAMLHEILENALTFKFETTLGNIHGHDFDAMILFDISTAGRLEALLGRGSSYKLQYRVVRSVDGVALNKDGTGFAKVELVALHYAKDAPSGMPAPTENEKVLQSSVVSFHFAGTTSLIRSVSWCIMKDAMDAETSSESGNGSKSESTAKESLEAQTVYPSMVSFDESHREKTRDSATPPPERQQQVGNAECAVQSEENPGMSI